MRRKKHIMSIVKISKNDLDPQLSEAELRELGAADSQPAVYDEDSPEMTYEMLKEFKRINHSKRTKKTASIRLSDKAQRFSEMYGKGYTSFLSRLIDAALDDEAMIKSCL